MGDQLIICMIDLDWCEVVQTVEKLSSLRPLHLSVTTTGFPAVNRLHSVLDEVMLSRVL